MGTRFLATREAPVHDNLKQALVNASELDTQLIFRKFRNTARVFKNSVAIEVAEIESRHDSQFEDVADLVAGERGAVVLEAGDMEHGIWSAGMSAAGCPLPDQRARGRRVGVTDDLGGGGDHRRPPARTGSVARSRMEEGIDGTRASVTTSFHCSLRWVCG